MNGNDNVNLKCASFAVLRCARSAVISFPT